MFVDDQPDFPAFFPDKGPAAFELLNRTRLLDKDNVGSCGGLGLIAMFVRSNLVVDRECD